MFESYPKLVSRLMSRLVCVKAAVLGCSFTQADEGMKQHNMAVKKSIVYEDLLSSSLGSIYLLAKPLLSSQHYNATRERSTHKSCLAPTYTYPVFHDKGGYKRLSRYVMKLKGLLCNVATNFVDGLIGYLVTLDRPK